MSAPLEEGPVVVEDTADEEHDPGGGERAWEWRVAKAARELAHAALSAPMAAPRIRSRVASSAARSAAIAPACMTRMRSESASSSSSSVLKNRIAAPAATA